MYHFNTVIYLTCRRIQTYMWSEKHISKLCIAFRAIIYGKWMQFLELLIFFLFWGVFTLSTWPFRPRLTTAGTQVGGVSYCSLYDWRVRHCSKNLKGHKQPILSASLYLWIASSPWAGLTKSDSLTSLILLQTLPVSSIFPAWKALMKGLRSGWLGNKQKDITSAFLSNIKVWGILKNMKLWDD